MKTKSNKQFMILSVIGITIMVMCHFAGEIFKYLKAFPFIAIFIFIYGYFYKKDNEENIWKYISYKFKKLMIPFFILNLIYGILVNIFKSAGIISYGSSITLYTLFVQPFINNSQFIFNFPAWFVPTLFLVNVCYIIIHKLSSKKKFLNDYVLLAIFVSLNIVTVYFKDICHIQEWIMIIFKVLFFLPFFHFGYIYKEKWQQYDEKIPNIPYILLMFAINFTIYKIFGDLIYDMHDFADFKTNNIVLPFITSVISILFYTRIAKILSKWLGENKFINYISNHTSTIMTHHIFIMFLFNLILYAINLKVDVPYFNMEIFKRGWICVYEVPGWIIFQQLFYVVLGITGPLFLQYVFDKIKKKIEFFRRKK